MLPFTYASKFLLKIGIAFKSLNELKMFYRYHLHKILFAGIPNECLYSVRMFDH